MVAEKYRRACSVSWCTRNGHQKGWCYFHHRRVAAHGDSPQDLETRFPPTAGNRPPDRRAADARFRDAMAKARHVGECWIWDGTIDQDGYGLFSGVADGHRYLRAHRYSYYFHRGAHPGDLLVCHTCDTPGCVNPGHLFLGSIADNNLDMVRKGRNRHLSGDMHRAAHRPESWCRGEEWWNEQRRQNNKVQRGNNWSTTKLPDSAVVDIRRRWEAREARQVDMAREYGVSKQLINLICLGKARKALPQKRVGEQGERDGRERLT